MNNKNIVITGGGGFIARYFIKSLSKSNNISVIDKKKRPNHIPDNINYIKHNLTEPEFLDAFKDCDIVIHLASLVDVKKSINNTIEAYNNNLYTVINVLKNMVKYNVSDIIHTSTSAVYGDKLTLPASEDHIKEPISDYGSSKLSAENIIKTRSKIDNIQYYNFRLGNIVGPEGHGVIQDFIRKLEENPNELKILGNGLQEKSYLYVEDCVEGMIKAYLTGNTGVYNLSSHDTINVNQIADIITNIMNINPEYKYTGGDKGWVGDVPKYQLDINKITSNTDWNPTYSSSESVEKTVRKYLN